MLFDPLNKMIINNNMPLTELKIDYQDDELSTSGDFLIKDGVEYSGTHLIIDLWGASRLDESELMEETLNNCVSACFATLLHIHIHKFSDTGGLSGVAVLAESHISVHTWPERDLENTLPTGKRSGTSRLFNP